MEFDKRDNFDECIDAVNKVNDTASEVDDLLDSLYTDGKITSAEHAKLQSKFDLVGDIACAGLLHCMNLENQLLEHENKTAQHIAG